MPTKQNRSRKDLLLFTGSSASREQIYRDIEERRLKEWENYQRCHRSMEEANANHIFLDISIGDALAGRFVVELYDTVVPQTVSRFRQLVTGSGGIQESTDVKLDYLYTPIDIINKKGCYIQFGDFLAYGVTLGVLRDETFSIRHTERGLLTMTSYGPHTSNTSFGITLGPAPSLDYKQVVFGKVVDGLALLDKLETVPTSPIGKPLTPVSIVFCGILTGKRPPGQWPFPSSDTPNDTDTGIESLE